MIKNINGKKDYIVPGDKEETITFCVDNFVSLYNGAIATKDFFSVALSGGSTPKAIFQKLATPPYTSLIDWAKVLVFWSDERSVSPDNPDSNYKMALDNGLKELILPHNTFRMKAEKNIEENAKEYEKLIKDKLGANHFDLVMLGMGDDGHTASLFPGTKGLTVENRLVIANHIPQKSTTRMTLTFDCINQSQNINLYVLGANKKQMVKEVLLENKDYPSNHVGSHQHKALWILDKEAAALIH
jgi:6-phosphogluconolactonase